MIYPECPRCAKKMKYVLYGEVTREPTLLDDWVYGGTERKTIKGDEYSCLDCNVTITDNEGYDPTL